MVQAVPAIVAHSQLLALIVHPVLSSLISDANVGDMQNLTSISRSFVVFVNRTLNSFRERTLGVYTDRIPNQMCSCAHPPCACLDVVS